MASRRIIERYILRTILPYAAAAFVLLTGILFVQQSGRYFETIFRTTVPAQFLYGLSLALLPTVLVFTIPMAILSGTIIGLGRMGSDSELIAMRAAGVSRWQIVLPALVVGLIATVAALQLNLSEAPHAQQDLRALGARAALYKLDSPVEPQTFTTDIPGYVIYVREGDKSRGQWGGVFIQTKEADGSTRLITARSGRIDSSTEKSELVLEDAVQTKLPASEAADQQYVVERLDQLRILFNTGRNELIARLQKSENKPDEMGFRALRRFINESSGPQHREGVFLLHKRIALGVSPLVFAFFGAVLAIRFRRGSRGFGALMSLVVMVTYYLLVVAGEQLTRGGTVPPVVGGWLATSLVLIFAVILLLVNRTFSFSLRRAGTATRDSAARAERKTQKEPVRRRWTVRFPTLLDTSVVRTMTLSFLFAFVALVIVFNIFTGFELWRFLVTRGGGVKLLGEYLFFLLPLVSVELFPGSVLVAALLTYALIARRREAVAWWASGQSVYRLMLPGFVFAMVIAGGLWLIQERIMPAANVKQDDLRARIRGNVAQSTPGERRWLVSNDGLRIYSYEFDDRAEALIKPSIYEFDTSRPSELKRVLNGDSARWVGLNRIEITGAKWFDLGRSQVSTQSAQAMTVDGVETPRVFRPTVDRPSQLDASRLREYIKTLKARGTDTAVLAVGLQRKYAAPFSVIIMALIGMPLAISLGRKSTVLALCSAVVVSLLFWLISSGFTQLGEHALLPPQVAVWAPIAIFAGGAFYFISRVRT
ncbi:MAG TPA: LptF/LptG family permease [Pyrinomonadaceae bacterium]|nr:LptF/LptG family permease [Pyrinomonadaceae bacterium]